MTRSNQRQNRDQVPEAHRDRSTLNFPMMLTKYQDQLAQALPEHIDVTKLMRAALSSYRLTPKLSTCPPESVFSSLMMIAQVGLSPLPMAQEAYLIPRWSSKEGTNLCAPEYDYRGHIKLARQSGFIRTVNARAVYAGDHFELILGTEDRVVHRPCLEGPRGPLIGAYVIAHLVGDDAPQTEFMSWEEIEDIRDNYAPRDKGGNIVGPWRDRPAPMAIKTVIRRAAKLWPKSAEMQIALTSDGVAMTSAHAERVLGSRGGITLDGEAIGLPEGSRVDLLMQQVADADDTEQLDHLAGVAASELSPTEARAVREAIATRGATLKAAAS